MGSGASKRENSGEKLQSKEKTLIKSLSGHTGGINCMDICGYVLLTGSDDRTARLWDLRSYECKVVLEGHSGYISCCKMWGENYALTGSFDKSIRKWNSLSGNCVLKLERHSGTINRLLIHGTNLFSSSYDSSVVCWNLRSGEVNTSYDGHAKSVLPIEYLENSQTKSEKTDKAEMNSDVLLTGSMDKTARLWNVTSATTLHVFRGHQGAVLCLATDLENNILFTGSADNTIRKWNLLSGTPLKVFKGHEGSVICLQMNYRLLYSASVDATARCWVAEFGDTTRKYVGHDHMVTDMKYYQGTVYTGSGDWSVRAFDAKSGNLKKTFKGHKYPVNCLQPYDDCLLSASYDGTVKVWNIKSLMSKSVNGSEKSFNSSMRSSNLSHSRHPSSSTTESDVTISKFMSNGRSRSGVSSFEYTNEISSARSGRKIRGGKIEPFREKMNGNNNNSKITDECGYITDKLQRIIENDSNRSTRLNSSLKGGRSTRSLFRMNSVEKNSLSSSPESHFERSGSFHNRMDSRLIKRISSDSLTKRPRTDSAFGDSANHSDMALVDEELQILSGTETSSNTSGYRTGDTNSPATPQTSVAEKPRSRQKSSVSFSPNVSLKENGWDGSRNSHGSRIPTSTKAKERHSALSRGNSRESVISAKWQALT